MATPSKCTLLDLVQTVSDFAKSEVFLMLHKKIIEYGLRGCPALLLFTFFLVSSAWAHAPLQVQWREGG